MSNDNKIIRLSIFQEKASFRIPYSFEFIETYPLPPFSSVLGLIHNILNLNNTLENINLSISGEYESIIRETVVYKKISKKESKNYPITVSSLLNLKTIIYIKFPDIELNKIFINSIKNPPYFLYLGRYEDIINHIDIQEIEENIKNIDFIKLEYNHYIPFEKYFIKNKIIKNKIINPIYSIPYYYIKATENINKKINTIKSYDYIRTMFVLKNQILELKENISIDSKNNTPIFWI